MKLRVAERLMLLNLLPQEGDIVTLRVVRDAQQAVGLSEEDHAVLDIHNPVKATCSVCRFVLPDAYPQAPPCPKCGGVMVEEADPNKLVWKSGADVEREIPIGPRATSIIVERLEKLNSEKKLTIQQVGLYERFVEPPEEDEKVVPIRPDEPPKAA